MRLKERHRPSQARPASSSEPRIVAVSVYSEHKDTVTPLELLDSLQLAPSLSSFRISMFPVHEPILLSFLTAHPSVKELNIITDDFDPANFGDKQLTLPHLERLYAPPIYFDIISLSATPLLRHAGFSRMVLMNDVVGFLTQFKQTLRIVDLIVPPGDMSTYMSSLRTAAPGVEELTVSFGEEDMTKDAMMVSQWSSSLLLRWCAL